MALVNHDLRRTSSVLAGVLVAGILGLAVSLGARPAAAQTADVTTVKGPSAGEQTTLTVSPRPAGEGISIRAIGVRGEDQTRWALALIGVRDPEINALRLTAAGDTLEVRSTSRPNGPNGPLTVYLTREGFLTLADREGQLTVNDTTVALPAELRADMKAIIRAVT